jgi:poly-gamma-glutamate capsule biosynthesis protein CapA/YwtB (metallophosphatase superfamily)
MEKRMRSTPVLRLLLASALLLPPIPVAAASLALAFAGDFLPGAAAEATIAREGHDQLFDGVRPILAGADAFVVNLETPLAAAGAPVPGKTFTFLCSPRAAPAMARARVKAVTLANNHVLDQGEDALRDTLRTLAEAGIVHAGAGENLAAALAPALLDLPGGRVALLSFSNTFPEAFWARPDRMGTAYGGPAQVREAVRAALKEGPVVACFHWGEEMMETPKPYQVELARLAIDAGACLVIGHHPHVPQPVEIYRGRPIFYGLGNFSFGSASRRSRLGLLLRAYLAPSGDWERLEVFPLLVDNGEVAFRPRPLEGEEGRELFTRLTAAVAASHARLSWEEGRGVVLPP